MKPFYLTFFVACVALVNVSAGDSKNPPPSEPLGFTLSTGYDSNYIFRGIDMGEGLKWVGVDYSRTVLSEDLSLDFGVWQAWYVRQGAEQKETDLTSALNYALGHGLSFRSGFTWYYYPDTEGVGPSRSDGNENQWFFGLNWEKNTGRWTYGFGGTYYIGYANVEVPPAADDISYYELIPFVGYALTDKLNAKLSYIFGDKLNNAANAYYSNNQAVFLELDRSLTPRLTVGGYVAYGDSPDDFQSTLGDNLNAFFGGTSFKLSF